MGIKLLALDIDDTLIHKGGTVSEANIRAINAARDAGVYVMLATGRGYLGASRIVEQLALDTLIVNYGGAVINDTKTGRSVMTTEMDGGEIIKILELANDLGLHSHIYQGDGIVTEKPHPYAEKYTRSLSLPYTVDPDIRKKIWKNVPKALIITEPERVDELLPVFQKEFDGRICVSASSPGFIEFNKLGVNKGTAVEWVANFLGIKREETAAIGDNTLDYELIKYAGIGAVVENGSESLKRIADTVVPSSGEDGVAYFIEKFVLEKEEYKLGFDIGGTNIVAALIKDDRIIKKRSRQFEKTTGEGLADELYELAAALTEDCGIAPGSVSSVGVCIPGSVDTGRGVVVDAHNLGLHDSPFRELVKARFNKPVSLMNDADAAALAEMKLGALRGTKNSMLVTIGTGIGVGIVLGGRAFLGGRGNGVEAGHVMMDAHGGTCTCGRRGCIETLCSASALTAAARRLIGADADAKTLTDRAKAGDEVCKKAFAEYAENLACALASYINILDPERIALGGGLSGAGDFLIDSIRESVDRQSFFRTPTPIVIAQLGNDAGLIGACLYTEE